MKQIILIKDGELALKGLNRSSFEDILVKNLKYRLKSCGACEIKKSQSTITVGCFKGVRNSSLFGGCRRP